jgi:hypothetical protein
VNLQIDANTSAHAEHPVPALPGAAAPSFAPHGAGRWKPGVVSLEAQKREGVPEGILDARHVLVELPVHCSSAPNHHHKLCTVQWGRRAALRRRRRRTRSPTGCAGGTTKHACATNSCSSATAATAPNAILRTGEGDPHRQADGRQEGRTDGWMKADEDGQTDGHALAVAMARSAVLGRGVRASYQTACICRHIDVWSSVGMVSWVRVDGRQTGERADLLLTGLRARGHELDVGVCVVLQLRRPAPSRVCLRRATRRRRRAGDGAGAGAGQPRQTQDARRRRGAAGVRAAWRRPPAGAAGGWLCLSVCAACGCAHCPLPPRVASG